MKIRLCFKIDEKAGFAEDENGNPGEAYVCTLLKNAKTYNIPSDEYKAAHEGMKKVIAEQMGCDIGFITPITLNEYLDETEDEE